MKKILFVDDESMVLEGLENLLFPFMDSWEMTFVGSGASALSWLEGNHVDIIVTDMRMPRMDGAMLLQHVKDRYPRVVRIVLSGHAELEAALRVMPIAHQFLSKPCKAELLVSVLERACDLRELISDETVRAVIGSLGELPARPKIYSEITRMLSDESTSLDDIASVVEQDIATSAKILQVVNTAFFSRGTSVTSVRQAVPRLGAVFVKNLVLTVEVFRDLSKELSLFSIDKLHDHSFLVGRIARLLPSCRRQSEDAFVAGVLHDVGKLVLATATPAEFSEIETSAIQSGKPLHLVEADFLGATHAEIGAYILGLWGLPYPVIEAVANHHQPNRIQSQSFDAASAVYVANALADEVEGNSQSLPLDMDYLRRLGVSDKVEEWRAIAISVHEDTL